MIENWELEMGESFLDYHGSDIDEKVFGGFLMAKEPELSLEIIEELNNPYCEVQNFREALYNKYNEENGYYNNVHYDKLIEYVVEFANLTENTRAKIFESLKDNT
jgi:hypothetical protein